MKIDGSEYDVALSFAGENRSYVERVAKILDEAGAKVFFDDFEAPQLWGQDLAVHFDEVYRKKSRYVVFFVSRHYVGKAWPQHEFQSALSRAVEEREPFLLPVRFDDTELPGLRSSIGYLDAAKLSPEAVANKILQKLGLPAPVLKSTSDGHRLPLPPPSDFNPYAEAESVISAVRTRLVAKAERLRQAGYAVHAPAREPRLTLRVMRDGRTLYTLDAWIGHDFGENTICFYGSVGGNASPGATNAHGHIEWDQTRGRPVIKLMNLSLLPQMAADYVLTADELADAIWEELVKGARKGTLEPISSPRSRRRCQRSITSGGSYHCPFGP